jgi:hypothetical protein
MRIEHACLMQLGSPDYHPMRFLFDHSQKEIRIPLVFGPFPAVSLGISHGSVHHEVLTLNAGPVLSETLMVMGAMLTVAFVGNAEDGIRSIEANTPLKAASRDIAAMTLHDHFIYQVLIALVYVGKTVYLLPRQGRLYPEKVSSVM